MTIRIKTNADGTLIVDNAAHTATLYCDVCGATQNAVNLNTSAKYATNDAGAHVAISLADSEIGGTCNSTTCWPLTNGTPDAIAIVTAKTA